MKMGATLFSWAKTYKGDYDIVANGTSCRHQIRGDGTAV